jgi:hypothetical protein
VDPLAVRSLLDDALVRLSTLPSPIPVRALEQHLSAALAQYYSALAAKGDASAFLEACIASKASAEAAQQLLQQHAAVPSAEAELLLIAQALERLGKPMLAGLPALELPKPGQRKRPHRATVDEPRLLDLERSVLIPTTVVMRQEESELDQVATEIPDQADSGVGMDLDALLAQATSDAAAADQPEPSRREEKEQPEPAPVIEEDAAAQCFGVQRTREEVEFHRARTFFEELAMMSLMRQPDAGELWRDLRPVEARLLARVDGILACGAWVLPRLVKLLEERPVPDPEMTWAAVFLYGSIAGDDALDQVARLVRSLDLDEAPMRAAVGDALSFAPHPGIDGILRPWLDRPEPSRRALAIHVLGRRRTLSAKEALSRSSDANQDVLLEAARALCQIPDALSETALARLLSHKNRAVAAAAFDAAFARRMQGGLRRAEELVAAGEGEFADAALFAAIGGDAQALALFERALESKPSPAVIEAAGWFGHLKLVDPLLQCLKGDASASLALQRLTGASLTEEDADPEYLEGEEPFGRIFRAPERELKLTEDADAWTAWWKKHRARANLHQRYRYGHLWSPQDNLWELSEAIATPRERRLAHLELIVRVGGEIPFDPRDFIFRQERQLEAWKSMVARARVAPGSWHSLFRR